MPEQRASVARAMLRMAVAAAVLGALVTWFAQPLTARLAGLFGLEMTWLAPAFHVRDLSVRHEDADTVFRVEVQLARRLVVNGHVVAPDPRGIAMASTLVGHALVPAVLLVAVAIAWPAERHRGWLLRMLALLPAVILLWMVDVPLILLGALWRFVYQALDPGRASFLWMWSVFLQGGGELAVSIVLGALIARLGARRNAATARKSPNCHTNDIMIPEH
jgi:hypothetical protein